MQRINQRGELLLQYKEEYSKDYPEIVLQALEVQIQGLLSTIPDGATIFSVLTDRKQGLDSFRRFILEKKEFIKTEEELFNLFESKRLMLDEKIKQKKINCRSKSSIGHDGIVFSMTFEINEDFVVRYFGVPHEEAFRLMKRKGFIDQFASLRLMKIANDLVKKSPERSFHSQICFDESSEAYSFEISYVLKYADFDSCEDDDALDSFVQVLADFFSFCRTTYIAKLNY